MLRHGHHFLNPPSAADTQPGGINTAKLRHACEDIGLTVFFYISLFPLALHAKRVNQSFAPSTAPAGPDQAGKSPPALSRENDLWCISPGTTFNPANHSFTHSYAATVNLVAFAEEHLIDGDAGSQSNRQ